LNKFHVTLLTLGLGLAPAHGSVIYYSDLASWQSASSNITTIDFEGIAPAGNTANESGGLMLSGVNFSVGGTAESARRQSAHESKHHVAKRHQGLCIRLLGHRR